MKPYGDGNEGIGILKQFLGGGGQQGFAPSQTAQIMLGRRRGGGQQQFSAMSGTGMARDRDGTGISIEPPILGGNRTDARVNWASGLGKFMEDTGLDNRSGNWLWQMMGGPLGNVNPWSNSPTHLGTGWSPGPLPQLPNLFFTQPIGPDTNLLGGSRHMGVRKNK